VAAAPERYHRRVARAWLLFVPCAAVACGDADRGRAERTAALAACADAIDKAGAAAPGEQLEPIARGCAPACSGLGDWLTARAAASHRPGVQRDPSPGVSPPVVALVAGCARGCDAAGVIGSVPTELLWPALIDRCGADSFGLPRDQPGLASEEWLVMSSVARWLERSLRAGVSDDQVPRRIEHVTGQRQIVLPLPVRPGLPESRFRAPSRARQFVAIGDGIRIGATPTARIRNGRVDLVAVPGADLGQRVDDDQVGPLYAQHADVLGAGPPRPPLVLADRATPLTRVLDVITRIGVGAAELAVAGDVAHAHPVLLERQGSRFATPEIQLGEAGAITIRGFGDDRHTDWDHLTEELDHFAAINAPVRVIELHPHPATTIADLVRILDACVVARIAAIVFIPPGA
jgi:hypothetical protein